MKKGFLVLFIILVSIISLKAQSKKVKPIHNSFSLGAELSVPTGIFSDIYNFGIGASAQVNFFFAQHTSLTIYGSYINYYVKSKYGSGSEGFIPILGGIEHNFSPTVFGSAQLGYTFYTTVAGSAFTYAPGIGFRINKKFTALFKYTGKIKSAISSNAAGLRIAYNFGK